MPQGGAVWSALSKRLNNLFTASSNQIPVLSPKKRKTRREWTSRQNRPSSQDRQNSLCVRVSSNPALNLVSPTALRAAIDKNCRFERLCDGSRAKLEREFQGPKGDRAAWTRRLEAKRWLFTSLSDYETLFCTCNLIYHVAQSLASSLVFQPAWWCNSMLGACSTSVMKPFV